MVDRHAPRPLRRPLYAVGPVRGLVRLIPLVGLGCAGPDRQTRPTEAAISAGGGEDEGGPADGEEGGIVDHLDVAAHCGESDAFGPMYTELLDRWAAQDALGAVEASPLLFVGSSTIRRWEGLRAAWADGSALQRGFGGAQLGEVAQQADRLVVAHDPRAIVVFAGTNDIDAGVDPEVVVERVRCLRARVGVGLGEDRPLLFLGITPSPARWTQLAAQTAVNEAVAAAAEGDAGLVYVDIPAAFLATGSPPEARLYAADGLHLSAEGYALFQSVLRPAVEAATTLTAPGAPDARALAAGTRVLVDLGPANAEDGELSPSPDHLGQHWNNWYSIEGDDEVVAGERLVNLVDTRGEGTGVHLVLTGGFLANGRSNGGLLWPDAALLGDLAVGSATGDFFFITGDDLTGGLLLEGLDPAAAYTLRFFAARDDAERRVTLYTVSGASTASVSLQTSGPGAGAGSALTNDDTVAALPHLSPDPWGRLFIDVSIAEGATGYLSILEITVE